MRLRDGVKINGKTILIEEHTCEAAHRMMVLLGKYPDMVKSVRRQGDGLLEVIVRKSVKPTHRMVANWRRKAIEGVEPDQHSSVLDLAMFA